MSDALILVSDGGHPAVTAAVSRLRYVLGGSYESVIDLPDANAAGWVADADEREVYWVGHANAVQGFDAIDLRAPGLDGAPNGAAIYRLLTASQRVVIVGVAAEDEASDVMQAGFDTRDAAARISGDASGPVIGSNAPAVVDSLDGGLAIAGGAGYGWTSYQSGGGGQVVDAPWTPDGDAGGGGLGPDPFPAGGDDGGDPDPGRGEPG